MSAYGDALDGATVVGDVSYQRQQATGKASSAGKTPLKGNNSLPAASTALTAAAGSLPFVDSSTYLSVKRPLLVPIGRGGVLTALEQLDDELVKSGHPSIISRKSPHQIVGREVNPGSFGLYEYGSQPQLILNPGRYPGLPLSNWIGCTWHGTYDLATNFPPVRESHGILVPDAGLSKLGLTIVQVSQNQAAVCLDPTNQVFVISDGGFVAMATSGAYRVLGLVDQTHLNDQVIDRYTKQVLGHMQIVKLNGYVAASFVDVPANNVVILQRKDELYELTAGQHYLTTTSVSLRGFYTKGEVQQELECDNIYTRDQVPVWLRMYLRYELQKPLELARHGYQTPFDALQDKTRSILTHIVAHLDYSSMARSRNVAPDLSAGASHDDNDVGAVFVSAVRTQATDELKVAAAEYGIKLEDLAIIDRKFKGEIAAKMDSLTTRALEAQVESANLDRENANKRRKQEGESKVQELQNQMKRGMVETEAMNQVQAARARAEAMTIEAHAKATAIKLTAEAEAEATRTRAKADADVRDEFAQNIARARLEVERTKMFGNRTTFAPIEAYLNGGLANIANVQAFQHGQHLQNGPSK